MVCPSAVSQPRLRDPAAARTMIEVNGRLPRRNR